MDIKFMIIIVGLWFFNIGWFYFSGEVPSRVEALLVLNLMVISAVMVLSSENKKRRKK